VLEVRPFLLEVINIFSGVIGAFNSNRREANVESNFESNNRLKYKIEGQENGSLPDDRYSICSHCIGFFLNLTSLISSLCFIGQFASPVLLLGPFV